jgi:hypothetical protein
MEKHDRIYTAEDLLQFLLTIPVGIRERLLISMVDEEGMESFSITNVEAFLVQNTEGVDETGLRFIGVDDRR